MSLDVLSDDHPLAVELTSLRSAVSHFQKEAVNASLNLQRHALDSANTFQQLQSLQQENAYLRKELETHRTLNDGKLSGDLRESTQVQELSLALRRLSDKLDLTEQALLTRNEELIHANRDRDAAKHSQEAAYALAVRLRGSLEMCHAGQRDLLTRVKSAEEERRMSDLVVEEYADLVRELEGRTSQQAGEDAKKHGHTPRASLNGLSAARAGLQKLLQESNLESEKLHSEISRLNAALEDTQATLEAERKAAVVEGKKFAITELVLNRLKADDNAAAKMVSRYMKFSQSSSDVLHKALGTMRARHAAILSSYESRIHHLEDKLVGERRQSERLRQALDDLTEDISRESYGRRREIALRLALLGREEKLLERLKRWLLRAHEELRRCTPSDLPDVLCARFERIMRSADSLTHAVSGNRNVTELASDESQLETPPGSFARILSAQSAVATLNSELQKEIDKRLFLEHQIARLHPDALRPRELFNKSVSAHLLDDENGLGNGHDGHVHQHAGKKAPITPESPIKVANTSSGAGSGRSPEESPYQAELSGVPCAGTHHSHEDLSTVTSTTSVTVHDFDEASVAPYSGPLIKSNTLSINDSGVSPINDNALTEPSAPERKAEPPEHIATESTHDLVVKVEKDTSLPSNSTLDTETAPPQSLEVDAPYVSVDSDARIGAEAGGRYNVTLEMDDDQNPLRPSKASVAKATNCMPSDNVTATDCETHENEVNTEMKPKPYSNVRSAEPSIPFESVQETSAALEHGQGPSVRATSSNAPGSPGPVVLDIADVSGPDSETSNMNKDKVRNTKGPDPDNSHTSATRKNEDALGGQTPSIPPQNHYSDKSQLPFPQALSQDKCANEITPAEDEPGLTDSTSLRLLSGLDKVAYRYDELQRSFRDCHLSLQQLKKTSGSLPQASASYQLAIERLDDYCEDARVEVEIRIADEERIARGYQTILSVEGALSSEVDEAQMRLKIESFIEGTDPTVRKALESLKHKLDDLEHDIASVKQAMHDPASLDTAQEVPEVPESPRRPSTSWAAWTGAILSPSRSPSPAPPTTFGAVMTSPRLRHSSSFIRSRVDSNMSQNPLAGLGLRIAMPTQLQATPPPTNLPNRGAPRPRVSSNMFGLGLGGGLLPVSRRSSMANVSIITPKVMGSVDFDDDLD